MNVFAAVSRRRSSCRAARPACRHRTECVRLEDPVRLGDVVFVSDGGRRGGPPPRRGALGDGHPDPQRADRRRESRRSSPTDRAASTRARGSSTCRRRSRSSSRGKVSDDLPRPRRRRRRTTTRTKSARADRAWPRISGASGSGRSSSRSDRFTADVKPLKPGQVVAVLRAERHLHEQARRQHHEHRQGGTAERTCSATTSS